jgi:hypothetical protein
VNAPPQNLNGLSPVDRLRFVVRFLPRADTGSPSTRSSGLVRRTIQRRRDQASTRFLNAIGALRKANAAESIHAQVLTTLRTGALGPKAVARALCRRSIATALDDDRDEFLMQRPATEPCGADTPDRLPVND